MEPHERLKITETDGEGAIPAGTIREAGDRPGEGSGGQQGQGGEQTC